MDVSFQCGSLLIANSLSHFIICDERQKPFHVNNSHFFAESFLCFSDAVSFSAYLPPSAHRILQGGLIMTEHTLMSENRESL